MIAMGGVRRSVTWLSVGRRATLDLRHKSAELRRDGGAQLSPKQSLIKRKHRTLSGRRTAPNGGTIAICNGHDRQFSLYLPAVRSYIQVRGHPQPNAKS